MIKFRAMIAAALAIVLVPTVATADAHTERASYVRDLRNSVQANRDRIKLLIQNHKGDRADLMQRLANLNSKLTELNAKLKALREAHASA